MKLGFKDILIYGAVAAGLVWLLFRIDDRSADAPPARPPDMAIEGPALPPPSVFDPEVLLEVGETTAGLGSAFSISTTGWWLTARHVVADCPRVGIIVGSNAAVPVDDMRMSKDSDLALLKTQHAPVAIALDSNETNLRRGQIAFHIGFPHGQPGEATSRLYGREVLIARGRVTLEEPVVTWAEIGRTQGVSGSLAGLSGGPVLNEKGRVIGVTLAESARRGRLYAATPRSITAFLEAEKIQAAGDPGPNMTRDNYGQRADQLRRNLTVAQVVCMAADAAVNPT